MEEAVEGQENVLPPEMQQGGHLGPPVPGPPVPGPPVQGQGEQPIPGTPPGAPHWEAPPDDWAGNDPLSPVLVGMAEEGVISFIVVKSQQDGNERKMSAAEQYRAAQALGLMGFLMMKVDKNANLSPVEAARLAPSQRLFRATPREKVDEGGSAQSMTQILRLNHLKELKPKELYSFCTSVSGGRTAAGTGCIGSCISEAVRVNLFPVHPKQQNRYPPYNSQSGHG